jgi:hypothetical protein
LLRTMIPIIADSGFILFLDLESLAERRVVAPAGQGLISSTTLSPVATHGLIGLGWSRRGKVLPKSILGEVRRKPTDRSLDHSVSATSFG